MTSSRSATQPPSILAKWSRMRVIGYSFKTLTRLDAISPPQGRIINKSHFVSQDFSLCLVVFSCFFFSWVLVWKAAFMRTDLKMVEEDYWGRKNAFKCAPVQWLLWAKDRKTQLKVIIRFIMFIFKLHPIMWLQCCHLNHTLSWWCSECFQVQQQYCSSRSTSGHQVSL